MAPAAPISTGIGTIRAFLSNIAHTVYIDEVVTVDTQQINNEDIGNG
jgi:hypothetical protein